MSVAVYNPLDRDVAGEFAGYGCVSVKAGSVEFAPDEVADAWQSSDRWGGAACPLKFGQEAVDAYKMAAGLPASTAIPAAIEADEEPPVEETGVRYACPLPECGRSFTHLLGLQNHLYAEKRKNPALDLKALLEAVSALR